MKLRMVQTCEQIFVPNGGGGTSSYFAEKEFDMTMEGGFIRIRSKSVSPEKARVHEVPMSNVASFWRALGEDLTIPLDGGLLEPKPEAKKK